MYGKIFRQMYRGTLATVGPWQALVTFQQMIVLADSEGVVDMTPEAISRETTIPLDIIRLGIAALELPDPDSRSPGEDGQRVVRLSDERSWGWRIVNYEHYRKLRNEEERRDYHRRYWREKRSKGKPSTDSTSPQHTQPNSTKGEAVSSKQKEEGKKSRERATRLPDDFSLTDAHRKAAEAEGLNPERTFAKFRDYWRAASGRSASKLDWDATWRNWCRNENDRGPSSKSRKTRYAANREELDNA